MAEKRGLGRGFDSLIPTDVIEKEFDVTAKPESGKTGDRVLEVPVESVDPNPHQPRQHFDEEALSELAASIKIHGVVQPLVTVVNGQRYQLVAGERRLRAAKLAGLKTVPVIVRSASEQRQMEVALIENLQRTDLNAIETATAYRKLMDQFNLSYGEIAKQVGKDEKTVINTTRLIKLPLEAKRAVAMGKITEGHARQILAVPSLEKQLELLDLIIKNGWSVRQTEDFVRAYKGKDATKEKALSYSAGTNELTKSLSSFLGAKVMMRPMAKGAGRLIIEYYSDEELQRIYETIKKDNEA
jgi:ParB family transcriptional regulator, chromosome partitioning protein